MNPQPPTPPRAVRARWNVLFLLVLVVVSLVFYSRALDNSFWHAEDFEMLSRVQQIARDPAQIAHLELTERFHPVPLVLFYLEYSVFGLEPTGWYVVNFLLHAFNAWLVYWLVTALLPDRRIAQLSGLLFAMGVGSYGKAVLFVAGAENLLITLLYLLIVNLYVRNDLYGGGRVFSPRYLLVLVLFLLVSFAKPTTFALVGGLLAYKVFFRGERGAGRKIFDAQMLVLLVAAVGFWIVREMTGMVDVQWAMAGANPFEFAVNFVGNLIRYIVHMFFPIHVSRLVETGHPLVKGVYAAAPVIRFVLGLTVISYSLFGFVFGNRTIRFFLAWSLISVLPYCAIEFPEDWLNIRYLYQTSIGFVFVLAAGTVLSTDLLHRRKWRRFLPLAAPLVFVLLSAYITMRLDTKYERAAATPESRAALAELVRNEPS